MGGDFFFYDQTPLSTLYAGRKGASLKLSIATCGLRLHILLLSDLVRRFATTMASTVRLDAFAHGAICALRATGAKRSDIAKSVRKTDGARQGPGEAAGCLQACVRQAVFAGTCVGRRGLAKMSHM